MTEPPTAALRAELQSQEQEFGPADPRLADTLCRLADHQIMERDPRGAADTLSRVRDLPGIDESLRKSMCERLFWLARLDSNLDLAGNIVNDLCGRGHHEGGRFFRMRAHMQLEEGKLSEAIQSLSEWLQVCSKDDSDFARAWCLVCLSAVSRAAEDLNESQRYSEEAATIIKDKCAAGYAVDNLSLAEIVNLYLGQERTMEALAVTACTLVENEDSQWAFNPVIARSLADLAGYFHGQRKYKQAESIYKRSLAIKEKICDRESIDYGETCFNLSVLYLTKKRYLESEPLLKSALKARVRHYGKEHSSVAAAVESYAAMLKNTRHTGLASKLEQRAREIRAICVTKFDQAVVG